MEFNKDKKILIIGLGLMGGSYAQALSEQGFEVGAIARRQEIVDYAIEKGWVKHGRCEVDEEYIKQFDIVVFALYPHIFLEWIKENQHCFKSGALITDVTGVKRCVIYDVQDMLREDVEFIGAHPMAGRESSGIEFADNEVFKGANYIVTPTDKNSEEAIAACEELGRALGFKTIARLTPEKHDEMIAFLSQLTHIIAVALMVCKDSTGLAAYTGDSFRDLTRIANVNDVMWAELFKLNKDELLNQIDIFVSKMNDLRECIENDETESVRSMMRLAKERRAYFNKKV